MAKQEKARAAPSAAPADEPEVIDLLSDSDDEASPAAAPAIMPAVAPLDSRESDAGAAALLLTYLCWAVSYIRDAELVPRQVC